ncbi:MAG: hypothetical protein RIG62_05940 [Cyclobacteriaceae bacterium]
MENIRHIKKHLAQEEYELLSKSTGYSVDYIQNCLSQRRNNRLIVEAARQLKMAG